MYQATTASPTTERCRSAQEHDNFSQWQAQLLMHSLAARLTASHRSCSGAPCTKLASGCRPAATVLGASSATSTPSCSLAVARAGALGSRAAHVPDGPRPRAGRRLRNGKGVWLTSFRVKAWEQSKGLTAGFGLNEGAIMHAAIALAALWLLDRVHVQSPMGDCRK